MTTWFNLNGHCDDIQLSHVWFSVIRDWIFILFHLSSSCNPVTEGVQSDCLTLYRERKQNVWDCCTSVICNYTDWKRPSGAAAASAFAHTIVQGVQVEEVVDHVEKVEEVVGHVEKDTHVTAREHEPKGVA